jgi:hypothetical protein
VAGAELTAGGKRKPGERTVFVREEVLHKIRARSNLD